MNKKSLTLLFAAALCGVHVSFAHDMQETSAVVETTEVPACCCAEVMPAQEEAVEKSESSLTEQEIPALTADEEQELEKLLAEFLKAQKEQEDALSSQEQE